jgi:hypothetical protein
VLRAALIGALIVLALPGGGASRSDSPCLLSVAPVPGFWSEATGQHTLAFVFTNRGVSDCTLIGPPHVEFRDARGDRVPFAIQHGGDQMLTHRPAVRVRFAPGHHAYMAVNKYRCDLGDKRTPTKIVLVPPGGGPALSASVRGSFFGWCGPGDPGSLVDVTPVEPSLRALSAR